MSNYTAIAGVGDTLVGVLWSEVQRDTDAQLKTLITGEDSISLESPADLDEQNDGTAKLSVYLYRVVENPYNKNDPPVPGNGQALRKPPLALDLYYLITPRLGAARDHHIVLGKVLQVFYDRCELEGSDLAGLLAGADAQLRVVLNPVSLEETTRIWQAMELSYRLSICYLVRVVRIDSQVETTGPPVVRRSSVTGSRQPAGGPARNAIRDI
jgi:hypothetical protein